MINIEEKNNCKVLNIDGLPQMIIPNNINHRLKMSEVQFVNAIDVHSNKRDLDILNIGLGAGYTAAEILKREYINKLDIVEIYKEVIDLLPNFDTYDSINNNDKVNIICDDAVNYIKNTKQKYDIIVIDVCHPHIECSKKLFEYTFLNKIKEILNENGIILFWYYNIKGRQNHIKETLNILKKIYIFVDFIEIKNSLVENQTYFFISNYNYKNNKDSIIEQFL